ncbi:glutathione S-transferase [Massariosphaeria phaeospora]|uniref:glutathione transferase n=1 Tax=Massariosphaeria phaeospora TaxID=100035 RepID=A0A7C8I355_9PLEO|nr:glutathione S-transferase [Massariosphaeria phaeospora]
MASEQPEPATRPSASSGELTLYVKKASPTSTANSIKPLILIEALSIPHRIHIIGSTKNETWFHDVNPYKMVPAMEDFALRYKNDTKELLNVFDSSACLQYLVDRYDRDGIYGGKGLWEKTLVTNWLMAYTAGLGATGKWWLMLKMPRPQAIGDALEVFVASIRSEYTVLEKRLSEPGQTFVALPDRPTIADFAILPLANADVAATADINFDEWPKLQDWSKRVYALPYVSQAKARIESFGLTPESG